MIINCLTSFNVLI